MRKADYTHLAQTIAKTMQDAINARDNSAATPEQHKAAQGQVSACERIAYDFARHASVNRDIFLRECGL